MAISRKKNGFSLVELVIATGVLSILVLVLSVMMLTMAKGLVKSREQVRAQRLARTIHVHLESMNFRDIFSCDSSKPFFGLTSIADGGLHSAPYRASVADPFSYYPGSHTLLAMQAVAREAGFPRFELGITFLRRDHSANRTAGVTSNLIPFKDIDNSVTFPPAPSSLAAYSAGDGYDDSDTRIRYVDINGDGDYFDNYFLGTKSPFASMPAGCISIPFLVIPSFSLIGCQDPSSLPNGLNYPFKSRTEMPDTRLKQVSLRLWNIRGDLVHHEGWVISEGGFTGNKTDDWESNLNLDVQQPAISTVLYSNMTISQANSLALTITKPYPAAPPILRADLPHPLVINGQTSALAEVRFTTSPTPGKFGPGMDITTADPNGWFTLSAPLITAAIKEGRNTIGGFARKNSVISPIWSESFVYDTRPPFFSNQKPPDNSNPVKTLTPFLGIQLFDDTSATTTVSGIAKEVIHVSTKVGGGPFTDSNFLFRDGWATYGNDWLVLASKESGLIEPFPDNSWVEVEVEGGDYAHYKTTSTWRVKINIDNSDSSSPTIKLPGLSTDGCSVTTTAQVPRIACNLDDPDSGIDWHTIHLTVNPGPTPLASPYIANVNLATTPRMADYFDPKTIQTGGTLTYQFPGTIPPGQYCLTVSVKNWKGIPSDWPYFVFNVP